MCQHTHAQTPLRVCVGSHPKLSSPHSGNPCLDRPGSVELCLLLQEHSEYSSKCSFCMLKHLYKEISFIFKDVNYPKTQTRYRPVTFP